MSLFGKKKAETKTSACVCNRNAVEVKAEDMNNDGCCYGLSSKDDCCKNSAKISERCKTTVDDICCVKVLGSSCKSCHELYENVQKAVKDMGLSAEVEYVTDIEKVVSYGVMSTPALVVNEKVVSIGKVLKATDLEKLFHKLGF